jgi:hypothetical protein
MAKKCDETCPYTVGKGEWLEGSLACGAQCTRDDGHAFKHDCPVHGGFTV